MCEICKHNNISPEFEVLLHGENEHEYEYEFAFGSEYEQEHEEEWELLPELEWETGGIINEQQVLRAAILRGVKDENDLANAVFFHRHPELGGRKLERNQPGFDRLSKEWIQIRDTIVRPALRPSYPPVTPSSGNGNLPPNTPPVEGPLKGITGYRGPSGKKCWNKAKSADIVDSDAPWNKPGARSAANYMAVLDYLNPGEDDSKGTGNTFNKPGENPRYQQHKNDKGGISTYCNIYVHDATRAMWANIPHWVRSARTGQWNELNANDTVTWIRQNGSAHGWFPVNKEMADWLLRQANRQWQAGNPGYPSGLLKAGAAIAASPGISKDLLVQPAYLAQLFANAGLPSVALWQNNGGIGHVAMIRPEEAGKKGKLERGIFRPRSAQAGAKNFSSNYLVFQGESLRNGSVLFWVHE